VLLPFLIVFILIFGVVVGIVGLCFSYFKQKQTQQIRSMLRKAEATAAEQRNPDLLRPAQTEDFLAKILRRFEFAEKVNLMLDQAGSSSTAAKLVGTCLLTAIVAGVAGLKFHFALPPSLVASAAATVGLFIPFLLARRKRSKNLAAFEEQFPEALDFLSRSMRAGHGFSVAMELLASDSPDPLGRSFRRVSNDMALGSSLDIALGKLIILVPLVDVRFFVSSVILQQETGGNLGEILTKLSYIIRERFRLKGTVKAVSAHGRVTGMVLLLMPLSVAAFLLISNPQYLMVMFANPVGRKMVYGAILGQIVGYFVIKKIIAIKV
jgi:tight adherence protein B